MLAAAVERGNLVMAASAAAVLDTPNTEPGRVPDTPAALLNDPAFLDGLQAALTRRETERRAEVETMTAHRPRPDTTTQKGDQ